VGHPIRIRQTLTGAAGRLANDTSLIPRLLLSLIHR
jgi:hypothetical protein